MQESKINPKVIKITQKVSKMPGNPIFPRIKD